MAITKLGKILIAEDDDKKSTSESLGVATGAYAPITIARKIARKSLLKPLQYLYGLGDKSEQKMTYKESNDLIRSMLKNKDVDIIDARYNSNPHNEELKKIFLKKHNSEGLKGKISKKIYDWLSVPEDSYHYDPASNRVYAPKDSASTLAHELGHATSIANKNVFTKIPEAISMHFADKAFGIRFLDSAQRAYNKEKGYAEEDNSKLLSGLSTASQLGSGLQLAEEGQASLRGLNAIRKLKGWGGVYNGAKTLLPAYGTYLADAAISHGVAPYLGEMYGKYLAKAVDKSDKDK